MFKVEGVKNKFMIVWSRVPAGEVEQNVSIVDQHGATYGGDVVWEKVQGENGKWEIPLFLCFPDAEDDMQAKWDVEDCVVRVSPESTREDQLSEIAGKIKDSMAGDEIEGDKFRCLLEEAVVCLGMDDTAVATEMRVSHPTVKSWRSGASVPHPKLRVPLLGVLLRLIESRLRLS